MSKRLTTRQYTPNATAPAIIERHSTLAYNLPSFATPRAKVAKATDGAAPNNPAKLVGLNTPPIIAKVETTAPPIRNRIIVSKLESPYTDAGGRNNDYNAPLATIH